MLGTRLQRGNEINQYNVFRQSLKNYVGNNFGNPADLDSVITDISKPMTELMNHVPKQITLIIELGYKNIDEVDIEMKPNIAEMLGEEMKQFFQRKTS